MASLNDYKTAEGFYVFHNKDLPNGPTRLTDDAVIAYLNTGRQLPKGVSMTPTAYAAYQQFMAAQQAAPPAAPEMGYDFGYDGGGGGGGGGYGGYTPPPRPELASSPEWLAYLNALGLEENQFRADVDRQRATAKLAAEQQIAGLGPQYDIQRRNITGSLESRGMARSGEKARRLADSRAAQGQQTSSIQSALTQQLSGLESNLAQRLIDIGSRRADRELQLRSQGYV